MPVYLRKFYLQKLIKVKEEEKKEVEKTTKKSKGISRSSIPRTPKRR